MSLFLAKFEIFAKDLSHLVCDRELEFLFKAHVHHECPDRSSHWRICSRFVSLFPHVSAVLGFFNTLWKLVPQLPCLTELDLAGAMSEKPSVLCLSSLWQNTSQQCQERLTLDHSFRDI